MKISSLIIILVAALLATSTSTAFADVTFTVDGHVVQPSGVKPALRAKIFSKPSEEDLNRWLAEHPGAEVVKILQTESIAMGSHYAFTLTVFYREDPAAKK